MAFRPRTALLVEDNPDDRFLFQEAFKLAKAQADLRVVDSGEEAIDFLSGDRPLPDLVFLDIKLMTATGFDVLERVRASKAGTYPVVLMLTSSVDPRDIERAYALGANAYLVKPPSLDELIALLKCVDRVWFQSGLFPK